MKNKTASKFSVMWPKKIYIALIKKFCLKFFFSVFSFVFFIRFAVVVWYWLFGV